VVSFKVPVDIAETNVNEQTAFWLRVRLLSGAYGFIRTVTIPHTDPYVYIVTRPPVLSKFLLGYTWQQPQVPAEHVVAYNDFQYTDRTQEATWPGASFQPFTPVKDATPAV
jgi:hypothetical protein